MKLIYCHRCGDVVALRFELRQCECGASKGMYTNAVDAWYSGPCVPLGFNNKSLALAMRTRPKYGPGQRFEAFVIEENCPTCEKRKSEEE